MHKLLALSFSFTLGLVAVACEAEPPEPATCSDVVQCAIDSGCVWPYDLQVAADDCEAAASGEGQCGEEHLAAEAAFDVMEACEATCTPAFGDVESAQGMARLGSRCAAKLMWPEYGGFQLEIACEYPDHECQ